MRHESKCRHLHGHRYAVEVTCSAALDDIGRVIDFGVVREIFGGWIDDTLDHGTLANGDDAALIEACEAQGWRLYTLPKGVNPTAENLARILLEQARTLLSPKGVQIDRVRVYETPNCWADSCD